jgi:hypothetical protein
MKIVMEAVIEVIDSWKNSESETLRVNWSTKKPVNQII